MGEYIITTDGGSEYIMHFGIKGQKWGVRRYQNPDGTLTEEGKKRYADAYKEEWGNLGWKLSKEEEKDSPIVKKMTSQTSELVKKKKDLTKQAQGIVNEFDKCKNKDYYHAVGEIAEDLGADSDMTVRDFWYSAFHGAYDDGGQGSINGYSAFMKINGKSEELDRVYTELVNVDKEIRDKGKGIADEMLGKYGSTSLSDWGYTVSDSIAARWANSFDSDQLSLYKVDLAADIKWDKEQTKALNTAVSLCSKMGLESNQSVKKFALDLDIDETDYADKKVSEMTSSDWSKLRKECGIK